ncbi:MAG: winged helix-turn-helix transcriptional regulator [Candidatus Fermentibacteraceae bacterium]|nr:winged helix-turn-helix transcriptional regulator [Candidatus Fermentibacteraceae bacterium]
MTDSEGRSKNFTEVMRAFNHPIRIGILHELATGSCVVSELVTKLVVEASLLSKHLAVLREAGLVECQVEWRCRRYNLCRPEAVAAVLTALNDASNGSGM